MTEQLYRQGKKRRMIKFVINELSAVDSPAQEPARALILKRRDVEKCPDECRTVVLLTSTEDGHSHAVWLYPGDKGGETSYGMTPDAEQSHGHPWVLEGTGQIMIGENSGHAHTVDPQHIFEVIMNKDSGEAVTLVSSAKLWDDYAIKVNTGSTEPNAEVNMSEPTKEELAVKAAEDAEARAVKAEATAERATKVAELTDAQKAHFNSLDEAGQTEYLGKSADDREAAIKKVVEEDPVVYTDGNGDEFRKSDDPRLVKMAKERDADRKRIAKAESEREQDSLEKRASEELADLPGDVKVRAAVLKAVDGIEDEDVRKAAHESIQAGNKAIKAAFQSLGERGIGSTETDAEKELERLAKALAAEKNIDFYDAYDEVAKSNPELAKRAIEGS